MSLPNYFQKAAINEATDRAARRASRHVAELLKRINELEKRVKKLEKLCANP